MNGDCKVAPKTQCDTPNHVCVTLFCTDNAKGQNETDVDCGGPDCGKCADGLTCVGAGDCQSNFCLGTICTACAVDGNCAALEYCSAGHLRERSGDRSPLWRGLAMPLQQLRGWAMLRFGGLRHLSIVRSSRQPGHVYAGRGSADPDSCPGGAVV